jgi:hypothetical protein
MRPVLCFNYPKKFCIFLKIIKIRRKEYTSQLNATVSAKHNEIPIQIYLQ